MRQHIEKVVTGSVLAVAIGGTMFMRNHYSQRIRGLEMETVSLSQQISKVSAALASAEEESAKLARKVESQTAELVKLRGERNDGEVSREAKKEIPPEPPAPSNSQPASISAADWKDLGGVSAQDAVQTFLWSLHTRNADRLLEFVDPADHEMLVKEGEIIASELAKVSGYGLLDAIQISPEQQMLRLRLDEANGEVKTEEFHFLNIGGRWRFSESAKIAYLKAVEASKP